MDPNNKRITIIRADGLVSVDGRPVFGLDLSGMDQTIHAVQWYGTQGVVEIGGGGAPRQNLDIYGMEDFMAPLEMWQQTIDAEDNPPPIPWPDQIAAAQEHIDLVAGEVRAAYVSHGDLQALEYSLAAAQARDYLLRFETEGETAAVPPAVASWVQAAGKSPEEAAQDIVAAADRLEQALLDIRAERLRGKAVVGALQAADPQAPTQEETTALIGAVEHVVGALQALRLP